MAKVQLKSMDYDSGPRPPANDVANPNNNYDLHPEWALSGFNVAHRFVSSVVYELPFARSGQGTAWDGLSRYDLAKYNPWYWNRLKQFADLCDQRGLVLFNQEYFQHNIIEAGAHWVDCPWRSANNINHTGFPEPPPFAGDTHRDHAQVRYRRARRLSHSWFV